MWKSFFPTVLLYGPCIICAYSMSNSSLCYLHSILKKYLSVVLSHCSCVVFVLLLSLHLSVCFVSL
jgi:hypothetical protein